MNERAIKILIIGLITIGVLCVGYFKIDKFFIIDSCLDKGGRWNYETNECETDESLI